MDASSDPSVPRRAVSDLPEGLAGRSALAEYERRRSRRNASIRHRFGDRLGGVLLAITREPGSTRAWATGARGEEKVAAALVGLEGIRALHDRRVKGTRANIDHLVVSRAGVFVIDAKLYRGLVQVRGRMSFGQSRRRLYVGRRDCSHLADAMTWQIRAVETALRGAMAPAQPPTVTGVLCFVDSEWPLLFPPHAFGGVRLESPRSLRRLVVRGELLERTVVEEVAAALSRAFPAR